MAQLETFRSTYARLATLPVQIEEVELRQLTHAFSPAFTRVTTYIALRGGGCEGVGADVTPFDAAHHAAQRLAAEPALRGSFTVATFSERLEGLDLHPGVELPYLFPRTFRRWGFESAALDLALRQADMSLAALLRRDSRPVRFVNSPVLGTDPIGVISRRLELQPTLRFKLDPSAAWTDDVVAELAATHAVDVVDLKGQYPPQAPIAVAPDPGLYVRVARGLPEAWLEDPGLGNGCRAALEPYRDASRGIFRSASPGISMRCRFRRVRSTSSRRGSARCADCLTPTISVRRAGCRCMAAGWASSARAERRTSTWPRCSIPTRQTISRRCPTTRPSSRRTCRRARCTSRRPRVGSPRHRPRADGAAVSQRLASALARDRDAQGGRSASMLGNHRLRRPARRAWPVLRAVLAEPQRPRSDTHKDQLRLKTE